PASGDGDHRRAHAAGQRLRLQCGADLRARRLRCSVALDRRAPPRGAAPAARRGAAAPQHIGATPPRGLDGGGGVMAFIAALSVATFVYLALGLITGYAPASLFTVKPSRSRSYRPTAQAWLNQAGVNATPAQFW